jgi:hypothetical protein
MDIGRTRGESLDFSMGVAEDMMGRFTTEPTQIFLNAHLAKLRKLRSGKHSSAFIEASSLAPPQPRPGRANLPVAVLASNLVRIIR